VEFLFNRLRVVARESSPFPLQTSHPKIFVGGDQVRGSDGGHSHRAGPSGAAKDILAYLGVG